MWIFKLGALFWTSLKKSSFSYTFQFRLSDNKNWMCFDAKGNCCFRVKNKDKMYFPKKCLYPKLSEYYLVLQINKAISRHFLEQNWMQCIPAATTDTFKRYIQFNVIFLPVAAYLFWVNAHPISVVWESLHWNVWKCQLFFRKVHNKNFSKNRADNTLWLCVQWQYKNVIPTT